MHHCGEWGIAVRLKEGGGGMGKRNIMMRSSAGERACA